MQNTGLKRENFSPRAGFAKRAAGKHNDFQSPVAGSRRGNDRAGSAYPPVARDEVKKQTMMILSTNYAVKRGDICTNL
ncbi:hypothetical protein [Sodalis sp. RH22]|uniref:hypothetical protein n=1 Tax=unclassified Sodalis (in: enterobacteria) TaxID=2636512 RepID=UPI0039B4BDDD